MNDDALPDAPPPARRDGTTLGSSTVYRLCEEVIALRERNDRRHQVFEQTLGRVRDEMKQSFNSFAADTQRAYQQLRQEVHGEKRVSLALLNELLEIGLDLEGIVASRPTAGDAEALARWAGAVEVEARKVQAVLARHGVHPFDAAVGTAYNPALHERVGVRHVEGLGPLRVAGQQQGGYASQQPEFVLRRPKVFVSE